MIINLELNLNSRKEDIAFKDNSNPISVGNFEDDSSSESEKDDGFKIKLIPQSANERIINQSSQIDLSKTEKEASISIEMSGKLSENCQQNKFSPLRPRDNFQSEYQEA